MIHVYFLTNDWNIIRKVQKRFGLPCLTVNGMTCRPCEVKDEDMELLRETERRGFIRILNADNKQ